VSIAKGSVFCLPQHLESYAADVFGRLAAAGRLRGLARDPFITGLAAGRVPVGAGGELARGASD
jgi:cell filamentation protein